MKARIYSFSGSGNTRHLTGKLVEELSKLSVKCNVFGFKTTPPNPDECDFFGICFPIYCWSPQWLIVQWVRNLPDLAGKKCFIFANYAGQPANAVRRLWLELKKKNANLVAIGMSMAPETWTFARSQKNMPLLEKAYVETTDKLDIPQFARHVIDAVDGRVEPDKVQPYRWSWFDMIVPFYTKPMIGNSYGIKIDVKKCTKCGLCVKNCPSGALSMQDFPKYSKPCAGCYGCINICQTDAIDALGTKGKIRYRKVVI
jgi:NAD-dependent dihydropyrimidine dehydrogenase PreA subunit